MRANINQVDVFLLFRFIFEQMRHVTFIVIFCLSVVFLAAQQKQSNPKSFGPKKGVILQFTYMYQMPQADLAKRFDNNSAVGSGLYLKGLSNTFYGIEGNFMFGGTLKEKNIFDQITDVDGKAMDVKYVPVLIQGKQRAFNIMLKAGKIFSFNASNRNSGLMLSAGIGYLEHWVRLDNATQSVAALQGDLAYGYDRLTGGFALNQFVGYQYLDKKLRVNFFAGLEFGQAFTKSIRKYHYDLRMSLPEPRLDAYTALKFGWLLPIYSNANADREYEFR